MRRRDPAAEMLALLAGLAALKLYLESQTMHQQCEPDDHAPEPPRRLAPPSCPKCRGPVLVRERDQALYCDDPCGQVFYPSLAAA